MNSKLTLLHTPGTVAISAAVAALVAVMCLLAWRKSGYAARTGLLEGLRFIIVAAILFTLNQPEWVERFEPEEKPTLAVLYDNSESMQTRDVVGDDSQNPMARAKWIQPRVSAECWDPSRFGIEDPLEVAISPIDTNSALTGRDESIPNADSPKSKSPKAAFPKTDLAAPLERVLSSHSNLRAVVLLSDGDFNSGESPLSVATRYRTRNIPIFTVAVGSETAQPDLKLVAFDAPTFTIATKATQIPFAIESTLPREIQTVVELVLDTGAIITKQVVVPPKGRLDDAIEWTPEQSGKVELKLCVPIDPVECRVDNNELAATVDVREESLQVLLIESRPRWEYRYLRNALVRDAGVEVSCLLLHPELESPGGGPHYLKQFPIAAELTKFDVVFVGDVSASELGADAVDQIIGLVKGQASGLILMPGLRGKQSDWEDTDLRELLPVQLDSSRPKGVGSSVRSTLILTADGRRSLLTQFRSDPEANARQWKSLPGFNWHASVVRARAGSTVLAVHERDENEHGRIPLLVTRPAGTGKVLFMGTDGAWRWREGVEDKFHYRFWGQVIRWMAYQRNMAKGMKLRLFHSPERPEVGDRVTLNANAMDSTGEPVQGGNVTVRIESPTGQVQKARLSPQSGEWGLYEGHATFNEAGLHRATVSCRETGESLEVALEIRGGAAESIGDPSRPDILAELATVSRGAVIASDQFDSVFDRIRSLPPPEPITRRTPLWASPKWAGLILVLLSMFWVGRKWNGTF